MPSAASAVTRNLEALSPAGMANTPIPASIAPTRRRGSGNKRQSPAPSMESPMPVRPMSSEGRLFAVAAIIEGITWTGLLLGMWLKYGADGSHWGVWLFGRLHGAAFLFYLATTLYVGVRLRWPAWTVLLALLAAIPPLVTIPLEMWFRRSGRLSTPG